MSVLAGIGQAVTGTIGANNAASDQETQNQNGINALNNSTSQVTSLEQPYTSEGASGINTLGNLYGLNGTAAQTTARNNFQQSPDYQFAYTQGLKAVDAGAAARGTVDSSGTLKGEQEFGSGLATQNYQNYLNGLMGITQLGQTASNTVANANVANAGKVAGLYQNTGSVDAQADIFAAKSQAAGINSSLGTGVLTGAGSSYN